LRQQDLFDEGRDQSVDEVSSEAVHQPNSDQIALDWWQAILLLLATGFAAVIAGAALSLITSLRLTALIIEVFVYLVPVVVLISLSRLREAGIFRLRGGINLQLGALIVAVAVAYSISTSVLVEFAHSVWPIPEHLVDSIVEMIYADSILELVGVVFVAAAVPAVAEELLFRGVVQPALIKSAGPTLGIMSTALLFAFYHLNPWTFVPLFIVGTFFGFLAYKTGTFWAGALAHFGNNLLAIVELNRAETLDYAALTEGAPWYILVPGAIVAVVGTVVLRNLMPLSVGKRRIE